jgi:sulfofructose kinase
LNKTTFDVVGIGLNATDTLLLVEEFPPYAGKVPFTREILSPGGQVASAMVCCARLGLKAKYIGSIGDDLRGQVQRGSLEGTGVDTSGLIVRAGCPNQTAYIVIDQRTGERTVLWHRAPCLSLTPEDLQEEDLKNARMMHLDGCDTEAAAYAASVARKAGIPVSVDVDTVYPGFEEVLKNTTHLVASSVWPGRWIGEKDEFVALRRLQREYRLTVAAMTLGDFGSLALADGVFYYSPAFQVHCKDTTGAGDTYHGAFCYAQLRGMTMGETLEFSNAAAALNCTALGARGHIPTLDEVENLQAKASAGEVARRVDPGIADQVKKQHVKQRSKTGLVGKKSIGR